MKILIPIVAVAILGAAFWFFGLPIIETRIAANEEYHLIASVDVVPSIKHALGASRKLTKTTSATYTNGVVERTFTYAVTADTNMDMYDYATYLQKEDKFKLITKADFNATDGAGIQLVRNSTFMSGDMVVVQLDYDSTGYTITLMYGNGDATAFKEQTATPPAGREKDKEKEQDPPPTPTTATATASVTAPAPAPTATPEANTPVPSAPATETPATAPAIDAKALIDNSLVGWIMEGEYYFRYELTVSGSRYIGYYAMKDGISAISTMSDDDEEENVLIQEGTVFIIDHYDETVYTMPERDYDGATALRFIIEEIQDSGEGTLDGKKLTYVRCYDDYIDDVYIFWFDGKDIYAFATDDGNVMRIFDATSNPPESLFDFHYDYDWYSAN